MAKRQTAIIRRKLRSIEGKKRGKSIDSKKGDLRRRGASMQEKKCNVAD